MFPFFLLLTQVSSASQSSLTSSTFSYQTQEVRSYVLGHYELSLFFFEVTSASVHTLTLDLQALQGNPNMYVYAYGGGVWSSLTEGSEYLEIVSTDEQLKGEGLGLQRWFQVRVFGASNEDSSFRLTITQFGTSDWEADSGESLEAHVDALRQDKLFTVKEYKGDMGKHMKAVETGSSWLGVMGGVGLLGVGVVAWRKWGGRQGKTEELAYRLI